MSSYQVSLVAHSGREQAVTLSAEEDGVKFLNGGKVMNMFHFEVIKRWIPASQRTKNPGTTDCLDLKIQSSRGSRDLRIRCQDTAAVNSIMSVLSQNAQSLVQKRHLQSQNSLAWVREGTPGTRIRDSFYSPDMGTPTPTKATTSQSQRKEGPSPNLPSAATAGSVTQLSSVVSPPGPDHMRGADELAGRQYTSVSPSPRVLFPTVGSPSPAPPEPNPPLPPLEPTPSCTSPEPTPTPSPPEPTPPLPPSVDLDQAGKGGGQAQVTGHHTHEDANAERDAFPSHEVNAEAVQNAAAAQNTEAVQNAEAVQDQQPGSQSIAGDAVGNEQAHARAVDEQVLHALAGGSGEADDAATSKASSATSVHALAGGNGEVAGAVASEDASAPSVRTLDGGSGEVADEAKPENASATSHTHVHAVDGERGEADVKAMPKETSATSVCALIGEGGQAADAATSEDASTSYVHAVAGEGGADAGNRAEIKETADDGKSAEINELKMKIEFLEGQFLAICHDYAVARHATETVAHLNTELQEAGKVLKEQKAKHQNLLEELKRKDVQVSEMLQRIDADAVTLAAKESDREAAQKLAAKESERVAAQHLALMEEKYNLIEEKCKLSGENGQLALRQSFLEAELQKLQLDLTNSHHEARSVMGDNISHLSAAHGANMRVQEVEARYLRVQSALESAESAAEGLGAKLLQAEALLEEERALVSCKQTELEDLKLQCSELNSNLVEAKQYCFEALDAQEVSKQAAFDLSRRCDSLMLELASSNSEAAKLREALAAVEAKLHLFQNKDQEVYDWVKESTAAKEKAQVARDEALARCSVLELEHEVFQKQSDAMVKEMQARGDAMVEEMQTRIDAMREEMQTQSNAMQEEMQKRVIAMEEEMQKRNDAAQSQVAALEVEMQKRSNAMEEVVRKMRDDVTAAHSATAAAQRATLEAQSATTAAETQGAAVITAAAAASASQLAAELAVAWEQVAQKHKAVEQLEIDIQQLRTELAAAKVDLEETLESKSRASLMSLAAMERVQEQDSQLENVALKLQAITQLMEQSTHDWELERQKHTVEVCELKRMHKEQVSLVQAAQADATEFAAKLAAAKSKASDYAARLEASKSKASDYAVRLEAAKSKASDYAARLEAAKSKVSDYAARLDALSQELQLCEEGHAVEVGDLQQQLSSLSATCQHLSATCQHVAEAEKLLEAKENALDQWKCESQRITGHLEAALAKHRHEAESRDVELHGLRRIVKEALQQNVHLAAELPRARQLAAECSEPQQDRQLVNGARRAHPSGGIDPKLAAGKAPEKVRIHVSHG